MQGRREDIPVVELAMPAGTGIIMVVGGLDRPILSTDVAASRQPATSTNRTSPGEKASGERLGKIATRIFGRR